MSDATLAHLSLGQLREAFRKRTLSPVEVLQAQFRQISAWEPSINALAFLEDEATLLAHARQAEQRWMRQVPLGPFDGIPVTVKDNMDVRGMPTQKGSKTTRNAKAATESAPAAARLQEAGAIVIGKTTTAEFGWKTVADCPATGITRNPWNLSLTPGGSSGGAAATMAAGIGYAALGTDAAGSIRIPAAFTGLVGFKATAGRVPRFPPSALGMVGHVGAITRSVEDAAQVADIIAQDDVRDWFTYAFAKPDFSAALDTESPPLSIAYSRNLGFAKVDPEVAQRVDQAVQTLVDAKLNIEPAELPLAEAENIFNTIFAASYSFILSNLPASSTDLVDSGLLQMMNRLGAPTLTHYFDAQKKQAALGQAARLFHQRFDLLCTPAVAVPAFPVERLAPADWGEDNWLSWASFSYPFNLTGQPAITIPCGFTQSGLPVGLQIVGGFGADTTVLRAASQFEQLLSPDPGLYPELKNP